MATAEQVKTLSTQLSEISAFAEKEMLKRPDWGSINFEGSASDQERLFTLIGDLQTMPLEFAPGRAVDQLSNLMPELKDRLKGIDEFTLDQGNPGGVRDQLIAQLKDKTESLISIAAQVIPYLAYRRGDVSENIQRLEAGISHARKLLEDGQTWVNAKKQEIETVSEAARTAAASAGAAVFARQFQNEATSQNTSAGKWLAATAFLAIATLTTAVFFFIWQQPAAGVVEAIQRSSSRILIVGILFAATVWCGRIYRALSHQAAVNQHRGVAISTLQAFVQAAVDDRTKDAVLLEATRTVFGRATTGLVSGEADPAPSQGVQFVEIGKAVAQTTRPTD